MNNTGKTPSIEKAKVKMADLCARSEQCEADIKQKLYKMGFPSADVHSIIADLVEDGFIDNARYARSYARDKIRFSAWGRNKIRLGLIAKRISQQDISQGLDAIEESDYLQALDRVAKAKSKGMILCGQEGRVNRIKLFRHILSRGFESELASRAINRIIMQSK